MRAFPFAWVCCMVCLKDANAALGDEKATGPQPVFAEYIAGGLYHHGIVLFNPSKTDDIELSEYSFRVFADMTWKTDDEADPTHFVNFNQFSLKPGQSYVACSQSTEHTVQPLCDAHYVDLAWVHTDSAVIVYGVASGDPEYDNSGALFVEGVDAMDAYFPTREIADNTIARKKEHGQWKWEVLPKEFDEDLHFQATPSPTVSPTLAPTSEPCDSSCTGFACEAHRTYIFEPPRVDVTQCRSEFGFCAKVDSMYGDVYCNAKSTWKACCLKKVKPVSQNCTSTCSSDPCHGGFQSATECRGLSGQCGTGPDYCDVKDEPHEVVLHRGFPEQNSTFPTWKPCCKDDGTDKSILRRDETSKWTSYCSHVYCQSHQHRIRNSTDFFDLTVVHHHNKERNGQKHVCKSGLHEHDKCGCECYGQQFGDQDIEELVLANYTNQNPECEITYAVCRRNSTIVEDAAVLANWNTGDGSISQCANAAEKRWKTCGGNGSIVSYVYKFEGKKTQGGFGQENSLNGKLAYNSTRHHSKRTQNKPLRETETFTSYCSHVFCVSKRIGNDNVTVVNHHNKERFGSKHVCKEHLHRRGKCGCECYNEDFGDEFSIDNYDQLKKNTSKLLGIESRYPTPAPTPLTVPCRLSYHVCTNMMSISKTHATFNLETTGYSPTGFGKPNPKATKAGCKQLAETKWKACGEATSIIMYRFVALNGTTTMGGLGGGYNYEYTTAGALSIGDVGIAPPESMLSPGDQPPGMAPLDLAPAPAPAAFKVQL